MATAIAQQIRLSVSRDLAPAAISARLAAFAKADVARRVTAGDFPPTYERFVDGREGAAEETVSAGGVIVYAANLLPEVAAFALGAAEGRSPERSGRYKNSWIVLIDGKLWTAALSAIPREAELTITNFQPYARKIDVGHMKMSVAPGIVEDVRQILRRQYSNSLSVERAFITLPGGYVLKGRQRLRRAAQNAKSAAYRGGRAYLAARKDTAAGQPMTYPSLIIRQIV